MIKSNNFFLHLQVRKLCDLHYLLSQFGGFKVTILGHCTDLGSLIGNSQCGTFRIFLPPRFYMKSIWVILKPQKLPFWPYEKHWILNFWKLWTFSSVKFFRTSKFKTSIIVKTVGLTFWIWNQPKLNGRKISNFQHRGISTIRNPN